jgi:hypothetical protein
LRHDVRLLGGGPADAAAAPRTIHPEGVAAAVVSVTIVLVVLLHCGFFCDILMYWTTTLLLASLSHFEWLTVAWIPLTKSFALLACPIEKQVTRRDAQGS